MKRQINEFEIAGILFAPCVAYPVFTFAKDWLVTRLDRMEGLAGLLIAAVLVPLAPSFLAVLAASAPQSRRFRIVNSLLSTFLILVLLAPYLADVAEGINGFLQACIYLAFSMIGAMGATNLWKLAAKKRRRSAAPEQPHFAEADAPGSSTFLSVLALASIPIVIVDILASFFVSLGLASVVLLVFMRFPAISLLAMAAAITLPLASLWALAKSLFAVFYGKAGTLPAIELRRNFQPDFFSLIDETAALVGVAPPDAVILHAEPTFFVMQGKIKLLEGKVSGRILAVGMPLIHELEDRELRSILAHEFAHFAAGDIAYSAVFHPAYRALGTFIESFTEKTSGDLYSDVKFFLKAPTLRFLKDAFEYFATIERAIRRFHEFRADRAAAEIYGKDTFAAALRKTGDRSRIIAKVFGTLRPAHDEALFKALEATVRAVREGEASEAVPRPEEDDDPLDTHPSEALRIAGLPDGPGTAGEAKRPVAISSFEEEGKRLSSLAIDYYGIRLSADEW